MGIQLTTEGYVPRSKTLKVIDLAAPSVLEEGSN